MSIPLKKESAQLFKEFRVYEKCVFCKGPTAHWHSQTNTPICINCGNTKNVEDIDPRAKYQDDEN